MLYLLDTNVLIDANRDYYPIARVPEFWDWLRYQGEQERIRIPMEVLEEITAGYEDDLTVWARDHAVVAALALREEPEVADVSRVVSEGYAADLTDEEVEKLGFDPFIIAYALRQPGGRCVVTTESSRPAKTRANRKAPDVCRTLGVPCCNTFELLRTLNFATNWSRGSG